MHPTLATIRTPAHLAPWVPPVRNRSVAVRFELGQIAPEPVPPVQYQPMPDFDPTAMPRPALTAVCRDGRRGPGCGVTFTPRRSTATRCPACRDTTFWPNRIAPPSLLAQQRLATRAVNQATRARARRSAAASRRQAA